MLVGVEGFSEENLQPGLVNGGLNCYLNSLILMLHRINFESMLLDEIHGGDLVISLLRYYLYLFHDLKYNPRYMIYS